MKWVVVRSPVFCVAELSLLLAAAMLARIGVAAPPDASREGLILHYSFDATAGRTIPDESGCGNVGTNNGAAWVSRGVLGSAMQFDGGQHIVFGTFPQVNGASALSFGGWIFPAAKGYLGVIGKTDDHNETFGLAVNPDLLQIAGNLKRPDGLMILYFNGTLTMNAWQHIMCVYDGRRFSIYKDGELLGEKVEASPATIPGNAVQATAGDFCLNRKWFFKGKIDDLRVYNRALTPSEVHGLANPSGMNSDALLARNLPRLSVAEQQALMTRTTTARRIEPQLAAPVSTGAAPLTGAAAESPSLLRITLSNQRDGEGDVTEYLPGETVYLRLSDVDLPANSGSVTMRVDFVQTPDEVHTVSASMLLQRGSDGAYAGAQSLMPFQPGPVGISIMGSGASGAFLLRQSTIRIHPASGAISAKGP